MAMTREWASLSAVCLDSDETAAGRLRSGRQSAVGKRPLLWRVARRGSTSAAVARARG